MSLLDPTSLSLTLDRINEALFYGRPISKHASAELVRWLLTRFEAPSAYANTFGVTEQDLERRLHTFTGEGLVGASLRHIHAEEACRALHVLSRKLGRVLPALGLANQRLLECFERDESKGRARGTYCCGPCTASLWRYMAAGGLGDYAKYLDQGLSVLPKHHNAGRWRRFPFYYTLLALSETDAPNARKEIRYVLPECDKQLKTLRLTSTFSQRKRDLLQRVLQRHG